MPTRLDGVDGFLDTRGFGGCKNDKPEKIKGKNKYILQIVPKDNSVRK